MLTNTLSMIFSSSKLSSDIKLTLKDRSQEIISTITFGDSLKKTAQFNIPFPNTLYIKIENNCYSECQLQLESMSLSGLLIPSHIVDQICYYQVSDSGRISRIWEESGTVSIDFFAADWIQYHLLYGNKITKL